MNQALRRTSCTRNDIVGIGLALVFQTLRVLTGFDRIAECGLDFFGRLGILNGDIDNGEPGSVAIGDRLDGGQGLTCDAFFIFIEHGIAHASADNFTHHGFCCLRHDVIGGHVVEQIVFGVANAVLHGKLQVHHVFIFGEHERVTASLGPTTAGAHRHLADLRQIHDLVGFKWVRQAPLETGPGRGAVLTEPQHQGGLAFLHDVKASGQPQEHATQGHKAHGRPGLDTGGLKAATCAAARTAPASTATKAIVAAPTAARLSTEHAAQTTIEITPDLIKVRRFIGTPGGLAWRIVA